MGNYENLTNSNAETLEDTEQKLQNIEQEVEEATNSVIQCKLENDKVANMVNSLNAVHAQRQDAFDEVKAKVGQMLGRLEEIEKANTAAVVSANLEPRFTAEVQRIETKMKSIESDLMAEIRT